MAQGSIRKRGKTYTYTLDAPRAADGSRRQITKGGFRTKKEAEAARTKHLAAIEAGTWIEPAKLKLGDYLEQWLNDFKKSHVTPGTHYAYERAIRDHLRPQLGDLLLSQVTAHRVQRYYAERLERGSKRIPGKGLAPRTVRLHHAILKEALKQAVIWGYLPRNPLAEVLAPPEPDDEVPVWNEADMARLIAAAAGEFYGPAVILTATTGMRIGEVLALRWSDVDLPAARLQVAQTLSYIRGEYLFKPPKTRKARRAIALGPLSLQALCTQQEALQLLRASPAPWQEWGLVFPRRDGHPVSPSVLRAAFYRLCRTAGMEAERFHALRHSHISQILQTEPVGAVSARVGHSSPSITLNIYGHLLPGMAEGAASRSDARLQGELDRLRESDGPSGGAAENPL